MSTTPTFAPPSHSDRLHRRLRRGPIWLARLLARHDPATIDRCWLLYIEGLVSYYAARAIDRPGVGPIAWALEDTLMDQLEEWLAGGCPKGRGPCPLMTPPPSAHRTTRQMIREELA